MVFGRLHGPKETHEKGVLHTSKGGLIMLPNLGSSSLKVSVH